MTAAWTEPARPAVSVSEIARAAPPDTESGSYTLRAVADKGERMVRVFVVYEGEPTPEQAKRHAEVCRQVPGATFRSGAVFGAPFGEPRYKWYGEMEFADRDDFKAASRTPEFAATGKDAASMGIPFHVHFAEIE
jgi:hypothetical protein